MRWWWSRARIPSWCSASWNRRSRSWPAARVWAGPVPARRAGRYRRGASSGGNGAPQRAVTWELGDEQVQIVAWSADPATFVMNSLIPAAAQGVELDLETRTAHITVASDQLSLAIGRGGENARLAAKLTGWRIDIRGDTPAQGGRAVGDNPAPKRTRAGRPRVRAKIELVRLAVTGPTGQVTLDPTCTRPGRGAYLCRETGITCLRQSRRHRSLARSLRVGDDVIDEPTLAAALGEFVTEEST